MKILSLNQMAVTSAGSLESIACNFAGTSIGGIWGLAVGACVAGPAGIVVSFAVSAAISLTIGETLCKGL